MTTQSFIQIDDILAAQTIANAIDLLKNNIVNVSKILKGSRKGQWHAYLDVPIRTRSHNKRGKIWYIHAYSRTKRDLASEMHSVVILRARNANRMAVQQGRDVTYPEIV